MPTTPKRNSTEGNESPSRKKGKIIRTYANKTQSLKITEVIMEARNKCMHKELELVGKGSSDSE